MWDGTISINGHTWPTQTQDHQYDTHALYCWEYDLLPPIFRQRSIFSIFNFRITLNSIYSIYSIYYRKKPVVQQNFNVDQTYRASQQHSLPLLWIRSSILNPPNKARLYVGLYILLGWNQLVSHLTRSFPLTLRSFWLGIPSPSITVACDDDDIPGSCAITHLLSRVSIGISKPWK